MLRWAWFLALSCILVLLAGCSSDDQSSGDAAADVTTLIDAHVGDVVVPNDATIDVAIDASIDAAIDAPPMTFNVIEASSASATSMTVTFDAAPDPTSATTLANFSIPGLTLSAPMLSGNVVTLTTTTQIVTPYLLTVSNVTRASDSMSLTVKTAAFTGHSPFDVTSAAATTAETMTVTFDAPPDPTSATTLGNYAAAGLTLSGTIVLAGNTVTISTSAQTATTYTVTVSNVTRASDSEALTTNTADFSGRAPFNVASASATNSITLTVTFDAPPDPTAAATLSNYSVAGLTLSGTPTLAGSTVTIKTSAQSATSYDVIVSNVTRASDSEPLLTNDASFTGIAVQIPTVTNVVVASTNPNNGSTPYNTGTATLTITGTDFATVTCPSGVKLDDTDGLGVAVSTAPTSCSVDSDTQITATLPAGIRTNASAGWNVLVTNVVGSNTTSAVEFVPLAGLLISEVYTGTTGNTTHEFIELYNPTTTSIDTIALGLKFHIRNSTGTTDTNKTLTAVTTAVMPSHGFLLIISAASTSSDAWYANRDFTYSDALVSNGGAYISLSATAQAKVIDKVGWGTQPAGGYEKAATSDVATNDSIERKPAGGMGHATDTDDNSSDFNAPSTTITPRGTADTPQP